MAKSFMNFLESNTLRCILQLYCSTTGLSCQYNFEVATTSKKFFFLLLFLLELLLLPAAAAGLLVLLPAAAGGHCCWCCKIFFSWRKSKKQSQFAISLVFLLLSQKMCVSAFFPSLSKFFFFVRFCLFLVVPFLFFTYFSFLFSQLTNITATFPKAVQNIENRRQTRKKD